MNPFLRSTIAACALAGVSPLRLHAETRPDLETSPEFVPMRHFTLPEDLELTLWARTPQLRNPTNMDIDAEGRIWITEGVNYRRNAGRDPKGDRIVVVQDTDGDGVADSSHVFVQEPSLLAPLGIAVIDNRIVVSNAPDLIVYTDVDRNQRFDPAVDRREVLLTGFHGRNHDHSLHSVTFGPDGRWYFNHGNAGAFFTDRSGRTFRHGSVYDSTLSGGGTAHTGGATPVFGWTPAAFSGERSDDGHVYVGGAAMRMRPDGTDVEVIGHNFRNSFEQTVTSFGDVFQNDNDDPPACRTTFLMEYGNAGYFSRDGSRLWAADRRPGQSTATAEWRQEDPGVMPAGDVYGGGAPAGIVFYEGDLLGPKWRGLLLSCEPARNTVFGYFPRPQGAGYALERFDFLTSNAEKRFAGTDFKSGATSDEIKTHFRPSDIAVGPDGAIYVADWFDPRVGGHRDLDPQLAGAIYRIAPKGYRSNVPPLGLNTIAGQLAALQSPAVHARALGYTRLRDAGAAAVGPVAELLSAENPYHRARALWLLAELGPAGISHVETALASDEPLMRVTAFRALRRAGQGVLGHARALAIDPSPMVRREVALALRDVPFAEAGDLLLTLAEGYDGSDRSYLEAWGTGCTGKEAEVYRALAATNRQPDPVRWSAAFAGLVWRLTPAAAVPAFAARAAAADLSESERLAATTALGFIPTRKAAEAMLELATHADGRVQEHALWWILNYKDTRWQDHGLAESLRARGLYDPDSIVPVENLVPVPDASAALSPEAVQELTGDPDRGRSTAQACLMCHQIDGRGIEYGPNLTTWASQQTAESLILAIIDPSADIAHGYDGNELVTTNGATIHGRVLAGGDPVVIRSMGGFTQMIPADQVRVTRRLHRSLMFSAAQLGLSAQDVADVAAWLRSRPAEPSDKM